jgi:hypothetical protein
MRQYYTHRKQNKKNKEVDSSINSLLKDEIEKKN